MAASARGACAWAGAAGALCALGRGVVGFGPLKGMTKGFALMFGRKIYIYIYIYIYVAGLAGPLAQQSWDKDGIRNRYIYIYICVINYIFHAHVLVSISKANAN